jgi:integrase
MKTQPFKFSETKVRALALTPAGRVEYEDLEVAGLRLRVGTAAKSFIVIGRPKGGKPERVTLGRFPKLSVEAARQRAKTLLGELADGKSRRTRERAARERSTFGEIAKAYFAEREEKGKRTVGELRASFERYLGALPDGEPKPRGRQRVKPPGAVNWEQRLPSEIDPEDVRDLTTALAAASGETTANRTLQLFRAIVNFGRKKGMIGRDHAGALADACELYRENPRTRRLNAEEVGDFFRALDGESEGSFRDFMRLLLFTGARSANVAALRWPELDLDARTWEIPATKAKAGDPIIIPLGPTPLQVLTERRKAAPRAAEFVFPAFSASGHMTAPKKAWAAFRVRAGLPDVRMHDVRRTLGSFMLDTGAPLEIIGKQLGHRDQKSTAVYAKLALQPVRAAQEKAEAAILDASRRPKPAPADNVAHIGERRTRRGARR